MLSIDLGILGAATDLASGECKVVGPAGTETATFEVLFGRSRAV